MIQFNKNQLPIVLILNLLLALLFAQKSVAEEVYRVHVPFTKAQSSSLVLAASEQPSNLEIIYADQNQKYLEAIRYGNGDIFIVHSHFAEWLNRQHNFLPVAQLSLANSILLVTPKENTDIFDYTDLVRKPVCNSMPLDAGFMMMANLYEGYPSFPIIDNGHDTSQLIESNALDNCDGLAIDQQKFERFDESVQAKFEVLGTSEKPDYLVLMASLDALTKITTEQPNLILSPVVKSLRNVSRTLIAENGYSASWKQIETGSIPAFRSAFLDNYWAK